MTACIRCHSSYNVKFYGLREKYPEPGEFSLCQACGRELSRFLTGEPTPGLGGDLDPKRGFEIERGKSGKDDTPSPEAE